MYIGENWTCQPLNPPTPVSQKCISKHVQSVLHSIKWPPITNQKCDVQQQLFYCIQITIMHFQIILGCWWLSLYAPNAAGPRAFRLNICTLYNIFGGADIFQIMWEVCVQIFKENTRVLTPVAQLDLAKKKKKKPRTQASGLCRNKHKRTQGQS